MNYYASGGRRGSKCRERQGRKDSESVFKNRISETEREAKEVREGRTMGVEIKEYGALTIFLILLKNLHSYI